MEEQGTEAPPAPPPPKNESGAPLTSRFVHGAALPAGVVAVGVLLLAAAILLRVPGFVDPALFPSPAAHLAFVRILIGTAAVLVDVAMFLLLIYALLVGVLRTDLSDSTRKAFMAFALILFALWFVSVLIQSRVVPFVPF